MSVEEKYENLKIYVIGMEATLAERRNKILELEAKILKLKANPKALAEEEKAYRRGWQDCSNLLANSAHEMARAIYKIRKDAFTVAMEGEKR